VLKDQGHKVCDLSDNNKKLGFYSVQSGMEIHIIDNDPYSLSRGGGLTDVSLIQKYKMAEEDYDKRKGTMREYFREQKEKNPNFKVGMKASAASSEPKGPPPGLESVEDVKLGDRCEVKPGGRRGTVRYIGEIEEISAGGYWVRF
jgi:tubulin-folding cofactor B